MKKALMVQLAIPRLNPLEFKANIHLAPGYLVAYAQTRCPDWEFEIMPRVYTDSLNNRAVISYICSSNADLVCFSTYLWNIEKTLYIASEVHKIFPSMQFIFGGPEVNAENSYLLNHEEFKIGISGEGEIPFVDFLNCKDYQEISGLIYKENGEAVINPITACRPPMKAEQNPYILGLIETKPDITLFFETVRGCPFRCSFCYYNKLYDTVIQMPEEYIRAMIRKAREMEFKEIFLLDPSFNVQPNFDRILDIIQEENPDNKLEIHTELRADLLNDKQIQRLVELNFQGIEIGLQSTNKKALELMNRSQNLDKLTENTQKMLKAGIDCKIDLIVGLPGDTLDGFMNSCDYVAEKGMDSNIQVFQMSVLSGTEFSLRSKELEIEYLPKAPYYVQNIPNFSKAEMRKAFRYAEDRFDINFDPLPPALLSTDFVGIKEDNVFFDGEVFPVHKLLVTDFSHPLERHVFELAESCAVHFRVPSVYPRIDEIIKSMQKLTANLPNNCFEIILESEELFDPQFLINLTSAIDINWNHYVNLDASPFSEDDRQISTILTLVLPEKYMTDRTFVLLSEYAEIYLIITEFEPLHIEQLLSAGYGLFFKGDLQAYIFDFLKHGDMLSDFTIFDSYLLEQMKQEYWADGYRYYHPIQVEI